MFSQISESRLHPKKITTTEATNLYFTFINLATTPNINVDVSYYCKTALTLALTKCGRLFFNS